jgi:hypothetical protein
LTDRKDILAHLTEIMMDIFPKMRLRRPAAKLSEADSYSTLLGLFYFFMG